MKNIKTFTLSICLFFIVSSCEDREVLEAPVVPLSSSKVTQLEVNEKFVNSAKSIFDKYTITQATASVRARSSEAAIQVDALIEELAAEMNNDSFEYIPIDETLFEDEAHDEELGLENTQEYELKDLSPHVQSHLVHFQEEIESILSSYEQGEITEEEGFGMIQSACSEEAGLSLGDGALSAEEKEALANSFHVMEKLTVPVANYLQAHDVGASNGRFWKKALRALARVAVGAVVTAVIIAVPVAAVAVGKAIVKGAALGKVAKAGWVAGKKVVLKASKIGAKNGYYELKAPILTGVGAGLKNASKDWDKSWKGWEELSYGYKIKF
ncbi:MAG: hypothetical protein ACLFNU_13290 [Bacteroidales bacterium]